MSQHGFVRGAKLGACIIVLSAPLADACRAAADNQDACRLDQTSAPYELKLATNAGELVIHTRRLGDTILTDGVWAGGREYHMRRRNGYDLEYESGERKIETVYANGLTDLPFATAKPSRLASTQTLFWNGAFQEVIQPVTKVSYLGEERVPVGQCSFETIHLREEPADIVKGSPLITHERWFSPGLDINLKMITDRQEPDGSMKRVLFSNATSIAVRSDEKR